LARKKKTKTEETPGLDAAAAILETFDEYKEVRCVSLQKGGRVENTVSTGSLILDLILGGGLQRGRIAEIYGPEGSGKTTIMLSTIAMGQRAGIPCAFYDTEHSLDPTYMKTLGIDLEYMVTVGGKKIPGFFYSQPGAGESVYMHVLKTLDHMKDIDPEVPGPPTVLLCIDSFAAMFSEAEDLEKSGKGGLGRDARMHSTWLRQLKGRLRAKGALLFVTNQLRMKLNLKNPNQNPESRPGGHAMKHYADYVIRVSASKSAKADAQGLERQHMYIRTVKNKCFPPFRQCEHELMLGRGLDKKEDATQFLKAIGRHEVRGSFQRVKLKPFDTGKGMASAKYRELTESPEFREYCFNILRSEKAYAAYFKQSNYMNYIYDATKEDLADAEVPE